MLNKFLTVLLLCVSVFTAPSGYTQDVEVGLIGGGTYYLGELNPGKQFLFTKPAYGGTLRFNFDDRWTGRFNILLGSIAGDDAISKVNESRNLRFKSSITELSLVGEFNFLEYFTGSSINYFTPFLFGGPGFFIFNPKAPYQNEMVVLHDIGTEGQLSDGDSYSLYGLSAVFGIGIKYSLTNRIGLGIEWGMRKTFTDYLDDVSRDYYIDFTKITTPEQIDDAVFLSDPSVVKHAPGMQRGNPQNNDWYSFAGATITYRFTLGEKTSCRDFENSNK